MKSGFFTKIGIFFIRILAKFPFRFIYIISDVLYLVIYYLIGYRKKVVFENLRFAFPEKKVTEIEDIAKKFYRHFCDITLESIKLCGMSEADFRERMKIKNVELADQFFEKGKSIIALTMHYNNWEWGVFMSEYTKLKILAVYKPLHNTVFDQFMNQTRSRFGTELVKNNNILRLIVRAQKEKQPVCVWLAGDQTPPEFHKFWFTFLNRDAMFYPGPSIISKRFNQPVIFMKIEKTGRGRYLTTLEVLCENPTEVKEAEIIKRYIRRMEEVIRENPEYYLWSHKRWKHKRPEGVPLLN